MASKFNKISTILYAPWRYGQRKVGVEIGSTQIMNFVKESSFYQMNGDKVESRIVHPKHDQLNDNEAYNLELFTTRKTSDNMNCTLVCGGDHSIAVGSVMGSLHAVDYNNNHTKNNNHNFTDLSGLNNPRNNLRHLDRKMYTANAHEVDKKLAVLWIDAHADINTLESSESGNVHGMPLAFLTGLDKSWNWVNSTDLKLDFTDLYYWGIRDIDNFEIDIIDKHGIKVLSDKEEAMSIIDEYKHIHTSLDIDGLDPKYAPSTGTKANHGLELNDVVDYLSYLKLSNKSKGIDIVEYNPEIGTEQEKNRTKETVRTLLQTIL